MLEFFIACAAIAAAFLFTFIVVLISQLREIYWDIREAFGGHYHSRKKLWMPKEKRYKGTYKDGVRMLKHAGFTVKRQDVNDPNYSNLSRRHF